MLMLGLFLALGMSLSVVQASMLAGMSMSGQQMSATGMGDCGSCTDGPMGAKVMTCDASCAASVNATLPQFTALLIQRPVDRPLSHSPVLSGWTASPNPHPPQYIALI
ncbi:MAG TPA: hypothetical protein VFG64_02550 [Dongiaceae bacterium]|nr:hypothetical protein [Dongiaceae bacterium]